MGNATVIFGVAVVTGLLLYMFFKLSQNKDEEGRGNHFLLQILILVFALVGMLIIAKAGLDDKDFCSWNVVNSTTTLTYSEYGYEYQCEENPNKTSLTFYKAMTYFIIIVAAYLFVYVLIEAKEWLIKALKWRK